MSSGAAGCCGRRAWPRLGLKDPHKPAAVLLFAGPTGTGKTELAKSLTEFLFGSEAGLLRCDMSEYMEEHSASKLNGAPPGYAGHGDAVSRP